MKIDKVREMGEEELAAQVDELSEAIFRTRIQKETGQLDRVGKLRELRKDLARVKTVMSQRRSQQAKAKPASPATEADAS